jgi:selenocysteine lyase/cysteine desulfurase
VCHDAGAIVVIDGAHALGNLAANLDVTNTGE